MGARAKLTKTDGTGRAMWRKDGEKAGSQVTMLENLDYEMDPFLQQTFISTRLCVPAFALGAGDMAVNTHTQSLLKKCGQSLIPVRFNANTSTFFSPNLQQNPQCLLNALEMNLREEMGGYRVSFLGWNEAKPEAPPKGHMWFPCASGPTGAF